MSARTIPLSLFAAGALAALGAACGSTSVADDLFGNPGNAAGDGGSAASSTDATTTASTGLSTSSSGETTTSTGEGGSSTSTGTMTTTSSGGDGPVVFCAGAPCAPGEVCCFNLENSNLDACGQPDTCGPGTITLSCNGPEDCPDGVCCGEYNGNGYDSVSCKPQCDSLTICTGSPEVCQDGEQCLPSNYLGQGYAYCE